MSDSNFLQEAEALIKSLEAAETDNFIELSKLIDIDVKEDLACRNLSFSDLSETNLDFVNLSESLLYRVNLHRSSLVGANLYSANLREANLTGCCLNDARLVKADLSGADLRGANLRGASLIGAILDGADLSNADLQDADLGFASLSRANLHRANLSKTSLVETNFLAAILTEANIRDVDLSSANFDMASLSKTAFSSTRGLSPKQESQYRERKAIFDAEIGTLEDAPQPRFLLKALFLDRDIAISVNQVVGKGTSPLTSYFFWPRNDAWEQLKVELESKSWISDEEIVELLNTATNLINYWQDGGRNRSIKVAQERFPNVLFVLNDSESERAVIRN